MVVGEERWLATFRAVSTFMKAADTEQLLKATCIRVRVENDLEVGGSTWV